MTYTATARHEARLLELRDEISAAISGIEALRHRMAGLQPFGREWDDCDEELLVKNLRLDALMTAQAAIVGEMYVS